MQDAEEWRPISGFEGLYEISNHGRVSSLPRIGRSGYRIGGRILKQSISNGYPFVGLFNLQGKHFAPRVHKLVATAFLGPRPKGMVINHIDYNKQNNHVSNLEYVTHRENVHHSCREARHSGALTKEEVQAVRSLLSRDPGVDLSLLAKRLEVSIEVIRGVLNASTYTLVPNKDGSMPIPIPYTHGKPLMVEDVEDFLALGFTIPQISRFYGVEYSTPYQMLRRAGIWQEHNKSSSHHPTRRRKQDSQASPGD